MGNTQQAYSELLDLRTRLREENTSVTGKEPKICTDESLMDMAVRLPAKRNDLLLIKGIGETFADKYGEQCGCQYDHSLGSAGRQQEHRYRSAESSHYHDALKSEVDNAGVLREASAECHEAKYRGENNCVLKQ